jgi:hypothetical protein
MPLFQPPGVEGHASHVAATVCLRAAAQGPPPTHFLYVRVLACNVTSKCQAILAMQLLPKSRIVSLFELSESIGPLIQMMKQMLLMDARCGARGLQRHGPLGADGAAGGRGTRHCGWRHCWQALGPGSVPWHAACTCEQAGCLGSRGAGTEREFLAATTLAYLETRRSSLAWPHTHPPYPAPG